MDDSNNKIKKELWILVALIVVVAGLIIGIVATRVGEKSVNQDETPVIETPENDEKTVQEVKKLVDLARVAGFLTSFGEKKVDLSKSVKGRLAFVIQAVMPGSANVNYDFVNEGYLLKYEKRADLEQYYKKTFGEIYSFESDLKQVGDELFDCAEQFGESYYCFKEYFAGDELIFESLEEPSVNGENGDYTVTGTVKVLVNLEETIENYTFEFERGYLKKLVVG